MTQNMNRRNPGVESKSTAGHAAGLLAGLSGKAVSVSPSAAHVQPVSRRRGKIAMGVGAAAALTGSALAAPEGAQIVVGNVTFTQQGNNWLITASNGAIIDYVSFDILSFETVRFLQPDAMSTVLNRINSAAPTRIDGTLLANGQVYFINPAGVTFGAGSFVDCAAIYAAAANLSNEDFLAGRNNFTDARGSVINEGTLQGSTIAMIGRHVANYGSISTPEGGTVVMAAGKDVMIGEQGGHLFARVSGDGSGLNGNAGQAGVENHGSISAPSGRALMAAGDMYGMAIFSTGTVRAREVNIDGGQNGVVQVSGKVDASDLSSGGTGGSIRIVGEKVGLVGATIDSRGAAGGGSVTIGRDLASASDSFGAVFIGNDTTINADATQNGSGGDVRIYGRDVARVGGNISARGAGSGVGGSVVMAGSQMILAAGVDTSGGAGGNGRWTIDVRPIQSSLYGPRVSDITITTNANDANIGTAPNFDVTSNANTVNINAASIVGQLNTNQTVTIKNANSTGVGPNGGRISLLTDLNGITGNGTLDIQSVGGIDIQGNIGAGAGSLNMLLTAGAGISIGNGFALNLGAGTFNSTNATGNFSMGLGSSIVGTGGGASSITSTAGNISINGDINVGGAFTATANSGFASLNGDLRSTGLFTVSAQSIIVSGGIIGNGVTLTATDDIGIDVSPGLSINAGTGALQIAAGTDNTGTLSLGSSGLGDMTLTGSTVSLSAGTLIDINTVIVNTVGNTTLTSSDFSITSSLAGDGANTLTFRGFGAGAKTFRFSAAGGTGDIDILSGHLANLAGFTSQTFGQAGDTLNIDGNLTLSRATIFAGATSLLSNVTLTGGANGITFAETVDGAFDLIVNTTGATVFGGVVGGNAALTSLTTNAGGTTTLTGNVTTTGAQDYNDNVVLAANVVAESTGNANITFAQTINGAFDLTVNTTGSTVFGGVIGGSAAVASLTTNAGGTTTLTGDVTTTGAQTFNDAVTLAANVVAASSGNGTITFAQTVDGAFDLTVNTTGSTVFGGIVGGGAALTSLTTNTGGTTTLTGDVTTSGAQTFNDAVTLAANVVAASTGNGTITFGQTVDGAFDLTVNTTGSTVFGGVVGGGAALTSLTTNTGGTTTLTGNVTTTGAQDYNDNVTLAANVVAESTGNANITFAQTVNGAFDLTVNTTGSTVFGGIVGGGTALTSLTTNTGGTTTLTGNVNTSGAQTFNDAVTLAANVVAASSGNGNITFAQTVDGAFDLIVNTTGSTVFGGVVGGGAALTSLSTNAGGTTTLTGNVTTTGAQDYNDNVTLAANVVAASTGNANITFAGTVDADAAANNRTLTVNTTGVTTFTGNIGATQTLSSLTTNAGGSTVLGGTASTTGLLSFGDALSFTGAGVKTLTAGDFAFGSTVTGVSGQSLSLQAAGGAAIRISAAGGTGDVDILSGAFNNINGFDLLTIGATAGTINLAANVVVFQDNLDLAGNVVLLSNSILSSAAGDQIKFSGTVNADAAANNRTLSINTVGATIFGSTVGATQSLASLTTNLGGTTTLTGNVTTSGAQTYNDAVILAANVVAASTNNQNITFANTVNADAAANNRELTINTTGTTVLGGVVGGTQALGALTTNAGGTTTIAANVTTSGAQTYNDAVRIGADLTLNSTDATTGGIVFGGNVDASGAGVDLVAQVASGRTVAFGSGATGGGGGQDLNSITTTGGNTSLSGTISTAGLQFYSGSTTLTGITNAISTGNGAISFAGTVDSSPADSFSLSVSTAGATTFGGDVGGTGRLLALTVDSGGNTDFGGNVSVLNTLDLADTITFTGAGVKTLTAGEFSFGSAVNGVAGQSLVLRGSGAGANIFRISAAGGTADIDILTASLAAIDGFDLLTLGATGDTIRLDDAAIAASDDLLFAGGVVLLQNAALTSTNNDDITFATTVDGGFDLVVNTTGATTFTGIVGGNAALNSLQTNIGGTTRIGNNITTVNGQTYGDDVVLTGSATLASTGNQDIIFNGLVNGSTANTEALTVNTGGQTQFNGVVGGTTTLASITTDAPGSTRIGANITTGGAQTYNDTVTLNAATTLASTASGNITFGQTVDGAFDLTVNTAGNTVFTGLVGNGAALTSITTDAPGTTSLGADVTTTGAQTFNDAVTLAANVVAASTGAGNITFGGTLNGAFDLTVNTTGISAFGGVTSINSLTTDAGGSTSLGANITTVAAQTYNDAVNLTGNVTSTSSGNAAITFANAVNGAFDLVVNTGGVTTFNAVGQSAALNSLTTGSGGSTIAKGSISVAQHISLLENVLVENAITFSGKTIFFGGTLDSNAGFADLTLSATGTPGYDLIPIRFGGNIGSNTALGSLTITDLGTDPGFATVVFSDQFALTAGTGYAINAVNSGSSFSVTTNGGNISFGAFHRVLSFGTLNLNAGAGTATFGDLTSLGDINVTAGQIQVRLRPGAAIFSNTGNVGSDVGPDLVAFGNINFSTLASFIGSGTAATYTTGTGNTSANLSNMTFRAFGGVLSSDLFLNTGIRGGTNFLGVDLKSDGPTDTDLSTLLAGAIPRLTGEGVLSPNTRISEQLKKDLKDIIPIPLIDVEIEQLVEYLLGRAMYNDMPDSSNATLERSTDYRITSSRLSAEFAAEVVESWKQLMRGKDEAGNYTVNREEEIRDILGHAWQTYIDDLKEEERPNANAEDFLLYLEKPNLEAAKQVVDQAREFFDKLDQMGLTPFEAAAAKKFSVLGRIKPSEMPFKVLRDTITPPTAENMQFAPQATAKASQAVAMR